MTDDSYTMEGSEFFTPRDFINAFLPFNEGVHIEEKWLAACEQYVFDSIDKFEWLGIFDLKREEILKQDDEIRRYINCLKKEQSSLK